MYFIDIACRGRGPDDSFGTVRSPKSDGTRHVVIAAACVSALVQRGVGNKTDEVMIDYVADRLSDADEIARSSPSPYRFLAAYMNASDEVPAKITAALHQAAEIACANVPKLPGPVVIGLDTSGSMSSAITGHRGRGATSKMRRIDVAALFAAATCFKN